jgi:hypothetical protein
MVLKIEWRNQACVEKGLVAGDVLLVWLCCSAFACQPSRNKKNRIF